MPFIRGISSRIISTSPNVATLGMLKSHHNKLVVPPGAMKRLWIVLIILLLLIFCDPITYVKINDNRLPQQMFYSALK